MVRAVRAMRPHLRCLPQRKAEGLDHGGQVGLKVDSRERRLGAGFHVPRLFKTVDYALDFEPLADLFLHSDGGRVAGVPSSGG